MKIIPNFKSLVSLGNRNHLIEILASLYRPTRTKLFLIFYLSPFAVLALNGAIVVDINAPTVAVNGIHTNNLNNAFSRSWRPDSEPNSTSGNHTSTHTPLRVTAAPAVVDLDGTTQGVDYTVTTLAPAANITVNIGKSVLVTDPNSTRILTSMKIELKNGATASNPFSINGALPEGVTASYSLVGSTGVFTLTGDAPSEEYQATLNQVQFTASPTLTTTYIINVSAISDGDRAVPNSATATITIVKSAPVIDLDGTTIGADYDVMFKVPKVNIGQSVSVIDADAGQALASMKIELTTNATASNPFSINGTLPAGISTNYSLVGSTGTFTLTGAATPADYQTALSQVQITGTFGSTYTINVSATSTVEPKLSNTATANITFAKSAPIIDLDGTTSGSNYSVTSPLTTVNIGKSVSVIDENPDENLASMKIELTTNATASNPFSINGTLPAGISTSYSFAGSTGTFTLTGAATPAAYQTALSQVQFTGTFGSTYTINVSATSTVDPKPSNVATANITLNKLAPGIDLMAVDQEKIIRLRLR